jgi:hypothetical protein
MDDQHD